MHPWPAEAANSRTSQVSREPPSQVYPHRTWTNDHVPPNHHSRNPSYPHAPRSASFSNSRSSIPNWNDLPPPPPLPSLPPSLFPGFHSPALAHSDRDLFFVETQRPTQLPRPWSQALPAGFTPLQSPAYPPRNPIPNSAPHWLAQQNPGPAPAAAPAVPTRPMYAHGYAHASDAEGTSRPMSYALAQQSYKVPSPPPAVPPRPMTAHGDIRSSGSASAPAIPPKPLELPPLTAPSKSVSPPPTPAKDWPSTSPNQYRESSEPTEERLPPTKNPALEAPQLAKDSLSPVPNPSPSVTKPASGHSRTKSADDVARAIELSLAEAQPYYYGGRKSQEEEDRELQQALADSLAGSRLSPDDASRKLGEGSNSRLPQTTPVVTEPVMEVSPAAEAAKREAEAEAKRLGRERDGKAAIPKLMEQEETRLAQEKRELERRDEEMARRQAGEDERIRKEEQEAQERRDAEMARRLASASEAGPSHAPMAVPVANSKPMPNPTPRSKSASGPKSAAGPGSTPGFQHTSPSPPVSAPVRDVSRQPPSQPPQYFDIVNSAPAVASKQAVRPRPVNTSVQSAPPPSGSTSQPVRGRTASAIATSPGPPQERPQFSRASSVGAGAVAHVDPQRSSANATGSRPRQQAPPQTNVAGPSTAAGPAVRRANGLALPPQERPEIRGPTSNNVASRMSNVPPPGDGVDPELLRGVSFGFEPPKTPLVPVQLPSCPPFPEVISLHPAPSPPFHIMALSWRHLMRLLAQFETRIEPSVAAIAQAKNEPVLRVVIQFLKLPYTANEWRTVVHLSIDQTVPPNTPQAFRFTNGDTTVLPYSVALGETPAHLQMSALSHVYAVPLSATTPFPILPLALPNLALYLQSAMRDSRSRKVQHDTSNTMRRLARIVNSCYPEEMANAESEERESGRGVGGLFKRVVGRGGAKRRDTQGNEDFHDMVTPFRIDKYTTVS